MAIDQFRMFDYSPSLTSRWPRRPSTTTAANISRRRGACVLAGTSLKGVTPGPLSDFGRVLGCNSNAATVLHAETDLGTDQIWRLISRAWHRL